MNCPNCQSQEIIKNGSETFGKPKYKCKSYSRQFVENPQKHPISEEPRKLIDKMLLERESLAGIVRVTGVSARWLPHYVNDKYENLPNQVKVSIFRKGRLSLVCEVL